MTKYCSDDCAKRAYKDRIKNERLDDTKEQTKNDLLNAHSPSKPDAIQMVKEMLNIKELSVIIGLSERTLFRLIKDKKFPKLKVGKRLLFNKDAVMKYMNQKYSNV